METHPVRWWRRIASLVITLGTLVGLAVALAPSPAGSRPAPRVSSAPAAPQPTDAGRDRPLGVHDKDAVRDGEVLHYAAGDPDALLDVTTSGHPLDPGRSPWVLVVHGGSWIHGGPADMAPVADDLAAAGYVAFSVEYPLVDARTSFTRQLAGLVDSWRWLREHATALGLAGDRGAVLGFSAGGHLAAMLGNRVAGVRAVVSMSGVLEPELIARLVEHRHPTGARTPSTEPTESNEMLFLHMEHWVVRATWNPRDRADLRAWQQFSPATYLSSRTPPTLVVQGLADGTVPPQTATSYGQALGADGVAHDVLMLPGVGHNAPQDADGARRTVLQWLERYDAPLHDRDGAV